VNDAGVRVLQLHTPTQIRAELLQLGADSSLAEQLARAEFALVKIERASLTLARFLYQELVMEGGQVVTAPHLEHVGAGETAVLLCATRYQFHHLVVRLRWQPSQELQWLAEQIEGALDAFVSPPPALELDGVRFDWQRTYVMGILNVTPDSFSGDALMQPDDNATQWPARALERARAHIAAGADILDVGGESTRPGAVPVDADTELRRIMPVLRALRQETRVPLSIDTSKARVADAALDAGAALVNDVTGLQGDAEIARVIAAHNAAVVLVHNGKPDPHARDFLSAMLDDLRARIESASAAGINAARIMIDPGLGFGKTTAQNLEILNRLGEFRALGCPLLIGPSRKGFIRKATDAPADERDAGTAAAVTLGIARGAHIVRVHDVAAMTRVVKMTDAILRVAETRS
jgi:dihydropteroate synthase